MDCREYANCRCEPRMEQEQIDAIVRDLKPMWEDGFVDYCHGAMITLMILGYEKEREEIYEKVGMGNDKSESS